MTDRFHHGLVVGKFYPPHVGHVRAIREAARTCERVSVVVAGAPEETLPLGNRVVWLAWSVAEYPHVRVVGVMDPHEVDYDSPVAWDAHMEVFVGACAETWPGVPVDVVVTGEHYGDEMARRLGASHLRLTRPGLRPSGTALRQDLSHNWEDLVGAARSDLARRVVVLGAESTGTTTLARDLADRFGAAFVPEYGRIHSAAKLAAAREAAFRAGKPRPTWSDVDWSGDEFTAIAFRQSAELDRAGELHPLVIGDTDALATSVWHDHYLGGPHAVSVALAARRPADLYVLTTPVGVDFEDDGLRDGEGREAMTDAFISALSTAGVPWMEATGDRWTRADAVAESIVALGPPGW